jgi:CRISPR-associated endonuclease Csn1
MEEQVDELEKQLVEWKIKSKYASTKELKDYYIQQRHYIKFDLTYWRKKLGTFACKEVKPYWKNSQLKDTQFITKFALPYLKTVFNKVEVQKGSVTAAFREIYKIQPRDEAKNRTLHSHHAIDAAVLTLIPTASIRDKILKPYFAEKDENPDFTYHENPRQWPDFRQSYITSFENDVINNYQAIHRTMTQTFKKVRKRGKQQYLRYKDESGKLQYKRDANGKKIPLIAKGDTIRGKLHKESIFGAIKIPEAEIINGKYIPVTDGKGNFVFSKNEKRKDNLFFVIKEDLSGLSGFEDIKRIIDPNLRQYILKEIERRIQNGHSFTEAILQPIWAFGRKTDKNGNPINPVRHVRLRAKGGAAFITNPSVIKDNLSSKHEYKRKIYALNGEVPVCALYQDDVDGKTLRALQTYSLLELTNGMKNKDSGVPSEFYVKVKGNMREIPLHSTLRIGQKVIFYKNDVEELTSLSPGELSDRLYIISKFEDSRINFKHHLIAMPEEKLKQKLKELNLSENGGSKMDFDNTIPKLRLSKEQFNFGIEHKHFHIKPDGQIVFQ